jgi:hypothetical protein
MEFSIKLKDDGYGRIFADRHDDDKVWMSVSGRRGSMAVIMEKEEAEQLINALQQLIKQEQAA